MGLSLKKKAPKNIAEKAGKSIWNCKSSRAPGLVNPPFKYSAKSASQVKLKVRPRKQVTCGQLVFKGTGVDGCMTVCIVLSLS